ncbi:MAG: 5'-nucleotidase C-terminal domain-containing protein [Bacteroidota bacterium]
MACDRLLNSLFFGISLFLITGCASGYKLTKTDRSEYNINNTLTVDSAIIKTYLPYKAQMEAEMSQVIGHSAVLMSKKENDKNPESLISNFFADASFQQALKIDPTIDFAMPSTKGGIRVDIPAGAITMSHIFETMPFENEFLVFTLSGKDVQDLLNFIAVNNGEPVAGLKMTIFNGEPTQVYIGGKAFDPAKNYRVLTTDYIAGGGDKFQSFKQPIDKKTLGLKVRDALVNYVKEQEALGKSINPKLDGRITKN